VPQRAGALGAPYRLLLPWATLLRGVIVAKQDQELPEGRPAAGAAARALLKHRREAVAELPAAAAV